MLVEVPNLIKATDQYVLYNVACVHLIFAAALVR